MPRLNHTGGSFRQIHDAMVGLDLDWSALRPAAWSPDWLDLARATWGERVQSEFRSIQVMTRFLAEVLGAGDPLEVYAGAADAIVDEIRHTALCVGVLEALGGAPTLPEPPEEAQTPEFLALPMAQRALATAISMLAINETISTAYIEDLRDRCRQPLIRAVLDATLADEAAHHAFGWDYVAASLARFDGEADDFARMVTEFTLAPHRDAARRTLEAMDPAQRTLAAWPEPAWAELGLASVQRQALVFRAVYRHRLRPRLTALGLIPPA